MILKPLEGHRFCGDAVCSLLVMKLTVMNLALITLFSMILLSFVDIQEATRLFSLTFSFVKAYGVAAVVGLLVLKAMKSVYDSPTIV